jgi:hypothetical protein
MYFAARHIEQTVLPCPWLGRVTRRCKWLLHKRVHSSHSADLLPAGGQSAKAIAIDPRASVVADHATEL